MSPNSCFYCSPCQNLRLVNFDNNKLASDLLRIPTESRSSPISTSFASTGNPASILALALAILSTNHELFEKFIETYLAAQIQLLALAPTPTGV